ncbi:MAG TPA: carboxylesterase family protein [Paracoccaceae bacterium]|nr:carboxylesterase family protein [Paracoccaceae bacterium]
MTSDPVAETIYGRVRGAFGAGGTMAFKGVRYAVADRFMPPRPPQPWAGVVDALQFGASAPQSNPEPPPGPPYVITAQIPPPAGASPPPRLPESEDCLFLNVWTAGLADGRKRPVMVWLHGGFFYGGSGSTVDGSALAARGGVVVVSLNHRLNAFGFAHLADLPAGEFGHSGNAGMLDIVAALEWVRDNIASFGGDPDRVMVFGASGGGMKTSILMASPQAEGLIHRAAMQSGPGLRFMEPADASAATAMLLAELGLAANQANDLALVPMVQLLRAYHAVAARLKPARFIDLPSFSPVLDANVLPRHPFSPDAAPRTRDIPMLIGWNAQEMSFFMGNDPAAFTLDEAGLEARAEALIGPGAADILTLYRQRHPALDPGQRYIRLLSDYSVMLPTLAQADRKAGLGGAPTYAYRFDFPSPALGGKLGAMHTLEASFVFDTTAAAPHITGGSPQAATLAATMSTAWANFAITGDPNGGDMPHWPRYDPATSPIMLLGAEPELAHDPVGPERRTMASLLGV